MRRSGSAKAREPRGAFRGAFSSHMSQASVSWSSKTPGDGGARETCKVRLAFPLEIVELASFISSGIQTASGLFLCVPSAKIVRLRTEC